MGADSLEKRIAPRNPGASPVGASGHPLLKPPLLKSLAIVPVAQIPFRI